MRPLEDPESQATSVDAVIRQAPFVILPLIVALAFALRFVDLGADSFWADEFWSLLAAKLSLSAMIDWTAGDVHPPLYYAVLHGWVEVAGTSEASLRAPSACFGAATVVILMLATWRAGPLVACGAGAMVALNGAHIAFSQEARMYPLVGCLALIACILLGRFIASPGYRAAALYAVSLSALLYTDYVGFLLGGIHAAIIAAYAMNGRNRGCGFAIGFRGSLALGAAGGAFVPWWSTFVAQVDRVSFQHIPAPTWGSVSETLSAEVGLQVMGDAWLLIAIPVLALALLAICTRVRDPILIAISTLALVPVLQILVSFGRQPIFDQKRALPFAGGFAFLFALGVAEGIHRVRNDPSALRRYAGSAAMAILTLPAGLFLFQGANRSLGARAVEDWRLPAAEVEAAGLPVYMWREYLGIKLGVYAPDADLRAISIGAIDSAQDGFVPIPRGSAGSEVMLLFGDIAGAQKPAVDGTLAALKPYFATMSHKRHIPGGVETYRLRAYSTSEYNVAIFGMPAPQRWGTDPDGYLTTTTDESIFRSRAILDFDKDNNVDVSFRLHIEYRLDEGTPATLSSRISGDESTSFSTLALLPPGAGEWREIGVPIAAGSPVPAEFALSGGLHVRTLELRRYEIDGGDVLRREADMARQWFLRPDGYLETAAFGPCVRLNVDGATEVQVTYEYLDQFAWHTSVKNAAVSGRVACTGDLTSGTIVRRVEIDAR